MTSIPAQPIGVQPVLMWFTKRAGIGTKAIWIQPCGELMEVLQNLNRDTLHARVSKIVDDVFNIPEVYTSPTTKYLGPTPRDNYENTFLTANPL